MNYGSKKVSMKNRRAVSQIIGSLIVLAVVASVGSVILFQGLNQINAFNQDLSFHDREHNEALREDILFEHIKFEPNQNSLHFYLANIGSIDSSIDSITVVKIDTQEMVVVWEDTVKPLDENRDYIPIEDHTQFYVNATLVQGTNIWADTYYDTADYKISITTSRGNFFDTIATPFDS